MRIGPYDDPDRYELTELRSRGGEGELWAGALDLDGTSIKVAIKVIYPSAAADIDQWRDRWRRQAEVLRSLDHPNLVRVREVFEGAEPHEAGAASAGRSLFLVMNWVDGITLEEWVSRNPNRDVLDVCRIVAKVAGAVDYLHSGPVGGVSVLHRDIKPSNVLVDGSNAVLIDFGLTRLLNDQPMSLAGTPSYWAPEVTTGGQYTAAADRFSLGALTYFALTGKQPDINNPVGMRHELAQVRGVEGRQDLADHVMAMLDRDPARRPSNTVGWASALAAGALSTGSGFTSLNVLPPLPPPSQPAYTPPSLPGDGRRGRRKKRLMVLIVAVLIAAAAGTAFAMKGGGSKSAGAASSSTTRAPATTTIAKTTSTSASSTTTTIPVSTAPIKIPSVVGLTSSAAEAALRALGIDVTLQQVESGGTPGTVKSVTPPVGATSTGSAVLVIIKAPSTMPGFVGLSQADATNQATALGADVTITEKLDPSSKDGTVLDQTPKAGEPFSPSITLVIARLPVGTFLSELRAVANQYPTGQAKANAKLYTHAIVRDMGSYTSNNNPADFTEYDLSRAYSSLIGDLALRDDSASGGQVIFELLCDGRSLLKATIGLGNTLPVNLDISSCLRLRLQLTRVAGTGYIYSVFGDLEAFGSADSVRNATSTSSG